MDNLLELLVPLVIAAIYFFGSALGKKGGDDASGTAPERDNEAARRQREIQEEIRRRIRERRGAGDEAAPAAGEPAAPAAEAEVPPPVPAPRPERPAPPLVTPAPSSGVDTPTLAYRRKMEEQMEQIRATRERAEALKREARERRRMLEKEPRPVVTEVGGALLGAPVVRSLTNPQAARAAFVYAEVLGPPAAFREPGPRIPALSDRS